MSASEHSPEVVDLYNRARELFRDRSIATTVEVSAQIIRAALLDCDRDGRREILAALGPALANTLLESEPTAGADSRARTHVSGAA